MGKGMNFFRPVLSFPLKGLQKFKKKPRYRVKKCSRQLMIGFSSLRVFSREIGSCRLLGAPKTVIFGISDLFCLKKPKTECPS